jgi:multiple sugar transport system permease protein
MKGELPVIGDATPRVRVVSRGRLRRTTRTVAELPRLLVLLTFLGFFLLPIVWLLLAPTKTDFELVHDNPFAFGSWHNFAQAWRHLTSFQSDSMLTWLENSAIYAGGAVALTLATSIPAGYALARSRFRGRKFLLTATLVVMLMPASSLVLPLFLELNAVGLIGNALSVILPLAFFPFGVYLTFIYFSTAVPPELLQAARLDGCGEWQVFRYIALPLARPVIALVGFFAFVSDWNNFFLPFVMIPDSSGYPVQVGLEYLLSATPSFNPISGNSGLNIHRPELALAVLLAVLPVLVVFLFAQRFLVRGLLDGANKE